MFRFSMISSSGSFLFISLSMLLILKIIKIFKKCYHSVVVMWQQMSRVPVMRNVWRRELDSSLLHRLDIRLDMASCVFSCVQISCHQALKDASGKHKTFAYLTKICQGSSGPETVVVKTYYRIQK
jgi:hypothetical protein